MRILFGKIFAKTKRTEKTEKTQKGNSEPSEQKKISAGDSEVWRDILAYWILGLGTEFGYVVMISAASDILHGFNHSVIEYY